MPQGTNRSYQDRSTSQLSANPCMVTPRLTRMPMAASFWVERFGMLTDRYGIGWMVNAGPSKL